MARRKNKNDSGLTRLSFLILIAAVIVLIVSHTLGAGAFLLGLFALLILVISFPILRRSRRLAYLRDKYGDEDIVQKILKKNFWEGQTEAQLRDSLGIPAAVDNNLLKTRKREIWKYQPSGVNRYRLRITLDNGVVVSWDYKN